MTIRYQLVLEDLRLLSTDLTFESPLSSLKLALMAALSFCTTARSSAIVFDARTLRMNCFTVEYQSLLVSWGIGCRTRTHLRGKSPSSVGALLAGQAPVRPRDCLPVFHLVKGK